MSYQQKVKYLRIAPKKLRLVAKLVIGKGTNQAIDILSVQKQKGSDMLLKSIKSAVNNAEANNIDLTKMVIVSISCNKGPIFMRRWIRPRGVSLPKRKYTSHAVIVFGEKKKTKKTIIKNIKKERQVTTKEVK